MGFVRVGGCTNNETHSIENKGMVVSTMTNNIHNCRRGLNIGCTLVSAGDGFGMAIPQTTCDSRPRG